MSDKITGYHWSSPVSLKFMEGLVKTFLKGDDKPTVIGEIGNKDGCFIIVAKAIPYTKQKVEINPNIPTP